MTRATRTRRAHTVETLTNEAMIANALGMTLEDYAELRDRCCQDLAVRLQRYADGQPLVGAALMASLTGAVLETICAHTVNENQRLFIVGMLIAPIFHLLPPADWRLLVKEYQVLRATRRMSAAMRARFGSDPSGSGPERRSDG